MELKTARMNTVAVSSEAITAVLDSFRYGKSFLQTEISALVGVSDMTVSRASRYLRRAGVLDVREEVDSGGVNKRHTVYPRDISSLLVIDLSGDVFRAVLMDTSLNILMSAEHIYNNIFDFEDNLRVLLNEAYRIGLIDTWKDREVVHSLPYDLNRKERMRRSRAKRVAKLVARMKTCFRPLVRLGVVMPNEHTLSALRTCAPDSELIRRCVEDTLGREVDASLSPKDAFLLGAPSVIASGASVATLANARSMLLFGNGSPFGDQPFSVFLCRKGARAPWVLPDGTMGRLAYAPLRTDVPPKRNVARIIGYFTPDVVGYEKDFRVQTDGEVIVTSHRATLLGAGIALRDSAWKEYVRFAE